MTTKTGLVNMAKLRIATYGMYSHDWITNRNTLAKHLLNIHGTRSMAGPVSALLKWRTDELVEAHREFHQFMAQADRATQSIDI